MKTIISYLLILFYSISLFSQQSAFYAGRGTKPYIVNYNAINCNTFLLNFSVKRLKFLDEATNCDRNYLKRINSNMLVLYYKDVVATYPTYNEYKVVNEDEHAFMHTGEPSCLSISFKNNNYLFQWLPDRRMNIPIKGYRLFYSIFSDSTGNFSSLDTIITTNSINIQLPKSAKWVKIKTILESGKEINYGYPVKIYFSDDEPAMAVDAINEIRKNDTITHSFTFSAIGKISADSVKLAIDNNRKNRTDQFVFYKLSKIKNQWVFNNKFYLNPQLHSYSGYEFFLELYYQNKKYRYPASGFYTTTINNRIKNDYYGFFVMNVGSKTWREAYIGEVVNAIDNQGYGGLFEDDTWYKFSTWGGDCYPPYAYSDSLWFVNMKEFLTQIKKTLYSYPVYFNGLYSKDALDLLNFSDGGMTEGFAYTHWSKFVNRPYWDELCNIGIQCQNQYKKHWLALGGIIDHQPIPRLFVLASYLLVSGDLSFYANAPNYQTYAYYPEFDIPLGEPKNSAKSDINELKQTYKPNNIDYFVRWFDNGLVAVNPNSKNYVVIDGLKNYFQIDLDDKETIRGGRLRTIQASDTLYPFEGHIYLQKPPDGKGLYSPAISNIKIDLIEKNQKSYTFRIKLLANDSSSAYFKSNSSLPLYIYADLSQLGGPSELVLKNNSEPANEKFSEYYADFTLPYGSLTKNDSFYVAAFSTTGLATVNKFPFDIVNSDSLNMIRNFSFEIDGNFDGFPDFWRPYVTGYKYDTTGENSLTGIRSIYVKNNIDTLFAGAYIVIDLNNNLSEPLLLSGWSKCNNVSGDMNNDYSIYADIIYNDDTFLYGQTAKFRTGTHDWEYSYKIINPEKPIKRINLYALFRRKTGEVWFDHIYLGKNLEINNIFYNEINKHKVFSIYDRINNQIRINWLDDFSIYELRLFNIIGQEIKEPLINVQIIQNEAFINLNSIEKGVYFISLNSKLRTLTSKVIVY